MAPNLLIPRHHHLSVPKDLHQLRNIRRPQTRWERLESMEARTAQPLDSTIVEGIPRNLATYNSGPADQAKAVEATTLSIAGKGCPNHMVSGHFFARVDHADCYCCMLSESPFLHPQEVQEQISIPHHSSPPDFLSLRSAGWEFSLHVAHEGRLGPPAISDGTSRYG